MLLSLVVFFTQSIQLSKIRRARSSELSLCIVLSTAGVVLCISAQDSGLIAFTFTARGLNLKQQVCRFQLNADRENGGAERDRTVDPLLAKQVLSQLSYSPMYRINDVADMVGLGRFELPTSPLSGVRSNQLSYRPGRPGNAHYKWAQCGARLLLADVSRKVSRTQLNVRSSYAASDHRC